MTKEFKERRDIGSGLPPGTPSSFDLSITAPPNFGRPKQPSEPPREPAPETPEPPQSPLATEWGSDVDALFESVFVDPSASQDRAVDSQTGQSEVATVSEATKEALAHTATERTVVREPSQPTETYQQFSERYHTEHHPQTTISMDVLLRSQGVRQPVAVMGDHKPGVKNVVNGIVEGHAEVLREMPGPSIIAAVNMVQDPVPFIEGSASLMGAAAPNGLLGLLNGKRLASVTAEAASALSGGEPGRTMTFNSILGATCHALARPVMNFSTGQWEIVPPLPHQLRDAVRVMRGQPIGQGGIILDDAEIQAARGAINKTGMKANEPFIEPLGQALDTLYPDETFDVRQFENRRMAIAGVDLRESGRMDAATAESAFPGTVLLANVGVRSDADRTEAKAERILALLSANALIAAGKPVRVLVVNAADLADRDMFEETMRLCQTHGTALVFTLNKITDESVNLVPASLRAYQAVDPAQAALLAAKTVPMVMRHRRTGSTHTLAGGVNLGLHAGANIGWERGVVGARSGGGSLSEDRGANGSYNVSVTTQSAEVPLVSQQVFNMGIPLGQTAVAGQNSVLFGIYDNTTFAHVGPVPSALDDAPAMPGFDLSEDLNAILKGLTDRDAFASGPSLLQRMTERIGELGKQLGQLKGSERPRMVSGLPEIGTTSQRAQNLWLHYNRRPDVGKAAGETFEQYVRGEFVRQYREEHPGAARATVGEFWGWLIENGLDVGDL